MNSSHRHFRGITFFLTIIMHMPLIAIAQSGELLVQAQLDSFIAVTPTDPTVQISASSLGDFSGSFSFFIESNTPGVSVHAIITKLYKGTDPNDTTVKPIDVNTASGVEFSPFSANASAGSDLNATFTSTTTINKPSGLFEAHQTELVNLESSQAGVFNQDVEVTATWTIDNTARPAGVYGGYVQLFVSAIP